MDMARPRKDSDLREPNLYRDPRKREGFYRYKRPDGSFKTFKAADDSEAELIASHNNAERHIPRGDRRLARTEIAFHVPLYIAHREREDVTLTRKSSWKNRKGALAAFGKHFDTTPVNELVWQHLDTWWLTLTYHQKKLRHAEFRRFFNWMMGQGLCAGLTYNPFTTRDDKVRLLVTGIPDKKRMRLTREAFWAIYDKAERYPALQIAMGVSLLTFMREGDICTLKWSENVENDLLKRVIGKSLQQRGSASAARLQWDVGNYELLKKLLKRARELSLKHYRCPYVISHLPKVRKTGKTKSHACQVPPRTLVKMFAECRDASGLYGNLVDRTPPTFHEVRSLAAKLAKDAGYSVEAIRVAMAHGDVATTRSYQDEHDLPYDNAGIVLSAEVLGRGF